MKTLSLIISPMSKLAKYLIAKEKKKRTGYLDLGNCGISDIEIEIPELFELEWLETLILSNGFEDIETQEKSEGANTGDLNYISKLPSGLKALENLKSLYLSSVNYTQFDEIHWDITPNSSSLEGLEVIESFQKLETLDCRYRNIGTLDFLKDLPKLKCLCFSNNNIADISALDGLEELKQLFLSNNQIREIKEVYNLPKLEVLDLSENQLTDVRGLSTFDSLKKLIIRNNQINNLKGIRNLKQLEILDLSFNPIEQIFRISRLKYLQELSLEGVGLVNLKNLRNLEGLKLLNLKENQIEDVEPLSKLSNLRTLILESNQIFETNSLASLRNLEILNLRRNQIVEIGDFSNLLALKVFNLSLNEITDISPLIPLLKNKIKAFWDDGSYEEMEIDKPGLNLSQNPLSSPPPEIIIQGNQAIIDFFQEVEETDTESDHFYEVKILIIGEGGAGKTSLFRKLQNPKSNLPVEHETTKGIDIHQMSLSTIDGKEIKANIWDFGGQEIYHATHQFFFSKRALYLYVDDTRNNDRTVYDKSFSYWLGLVDLLGGGSPLLIVQNEKGDRSKQLDIRSMRSRFDFIKEVLPTNLMTGRGVTAIQKSAESYIQRLPHIGSPLPKSWVDIRKEIEVLSKQNPVISSDKWRDLCKKHGITEAARRKSVSQYFHDVGVFLHFLEDTLLRKSVILQKEWATAAVYHALDDELVKSNGGQFEESDLARLWSEGDLPDYKDELLALMEKFELCFELPNRSKKRWLAPQLLPYEQPDYEWITKDNRELQFKYEFLPRGLVSRLIVRLHRFVVRTDLAWRSGVVLERLGAQAEVTELSDEGIRIRVHGEDRAFRKELLTIIVNEFEELHRTFSGIRMEKLIACNCKVCNKSEKPHLYKHAALLQRKKRGKATQECQESYETVSIEDLLDEVLTVVAKKKNLNKKELLKRLIADNEKDEVFRQLKKEMPDEDLVLQVEGQWNRLRKDEIAEVLTHQQTNVERNKITKKLLDLVGMVK